MEEEWKANGGLMGMLGMTGQLAFEQKSNLNIDFVLKGYKQTLSRPQPL